MAERHLPLRSDCFARRLRNKISNQFQLITYIQANLTQLSSKKLCAGLRMNVRQAKTGSITGINHPQGVEKHADIAFIAERSQATRPACAGWLSSVVSWIARTCRRPAAIAPVRAQALTINGSGVTLSFARQRPNSASRARLPASCRRQTVCFDIMR